MKAEAKKTLKMETSDTLFVQCCGMANVQPTRRQMSKYKRGWGSAFAKREEAIRQNNAWRNKN